MITIVFHNDLQYMIIIKMISFNKFILKYKRLMSTENLLYFKKTLINLVYGNQ